MGGRNSKRNLKPRILSNGWLMSQSGLRLVESFLSIQGEGKFQGRLAIFLRFFGCNLNCAGFNVKVKSQKTGEILTGCDTIRAVFTGHFEAKTFSKDEILSIVDRYCKDLKFKPIIVMTGGEPLIHHKDENFINLTSEFLRREFEVHFETNATIEIDFDKFPVYRSCYFALGIKLSNSGISKAKRINESAIKSICQNAKDSFYKFVLHKPTSDDLEQILQVLNIYKNEVWCMPMGAEQDELSRNALAVANFAIKHGFNYSERIHIRIWDKKEGV